MDLVFNNVYLVEAIAKTDPSLDVFIRLMMTNRLFNRYIKANVGVHLALYALHDKWLLRSVTHYNTPHIDGCSLMPGWTRIQYNHPHTGDLHRLSGAAVIDGFDEPGLSPKHWYYVMSKPSCGPFINGPRL
jgi:hypothetical protein